MGEANKSLVKPLSSEAIAKGYGYTVVKDIAAPSQFDISQLKPRSPLKDGESRISGEEMRRRAVEFKGNLGLCATASACSPSRTKFQRSFGISTSCSPARFCAIPTATSI